MAEVSEIIIYILRWRKGVNRPVCSDSICKIEFFPVDFILVQKTILKRSSEFVVEYC